MTTLYKTLLAGRPNTLQRDIDINRIIAPGALCGCSSCVEAMDAGLQEGTKLLQEHCPNYLIQVGLSMVALGKWSLVALARQQLEDDPAFLPVAMERFDEIIKAFHVVLGAYPEKIADQAESAMNDPN